MKVTKVSITVHQFHKSKGKGNKSLNIRIDYKNYIIYITLIFNLVASLYKAQFAYQKL